MTLPEATEWANRKIGPCSGNGGLDAQGGVMMQVLLPGDAVAIPLPWRKLVEAAEADMTPDQIRRLVGLA